MAVLMPEGRMRMVHREDPKKVILDQIKDKGGLDDLKIMANNVLVAIYRRPKQTASGLWITDKTGDEDIWQGKVGLVVSMGPLAFVDDDTVKFEVKAKVGDWVWFRPSDTIHVEVNGMQMRVMREHAILGIIPHPDYVF